MYTKEVNEQSPLRILEKSIHGGLGKGNLGVVMARAGVGKTACLVQIALDDLLRGRDVLHVALGQTVEHVPHPMQRCGSTLMWSPSDEMACVEQAAMHALQPTISERLCAQRFSRKEKYFGFSNSPTDWRSSSSIRDSAAASPSAWK